MVLPPNNMIQRTSTCEEDYVGDEEILRLLEGCRVEFLAGNKAQLFRCICLGARFQAVLPEWATDAVLALQENLERGRVTDFNEGFGGPADKVNTRAASSRKAKAKPHVLEELWRLRRNGVSLNDAEMFPEALENLKLRRVNVNHRDIQEIYAAHGGFLKDIPRNPVPNTNYGFAHVTLPKPRRRGRGILSDEEAV